MWKLLAAAMVVSLLAGPAMAKGAGAGGGHGGGGVSHGGPSDGAPTSVGPLSDNDWRVQWVLQHDRASSVAGAATQAPGG